MKLSDLKIFLLKKVFNMHRIFFLLIILLAITTYPAYTEEPEIGYFALYFNGSRCGYAVESRSIDGDKVINKETIYLELKRMGTPIEMEISETSIETESGGPLGFRLEQKMAMMDMTISGIISPDGTMKIETQNAGNTQTMERIYPEGAIMSEGLSLLIREHGLEPGTSYSADVFSPSALQVLDMTFYVGDKTNVDLLGRVLELTEIKMEYTVSGSGKISSTYFLDEEYNVQKMILPMAGMDIVMVSCTEKFARSNLEAAELVGGMIIKSPVEISNPEKAKEILYTVVPKEPETVLHFPATDIQSVESLDSGNVIVAVRPLEGDSNAMFPYKGRDPEILKSLKSTPYIQSDHPEIIKLAASCVKDMNYALDAALAIEKFVGNHIVKKDLSIGYASALEVARSRQGDCTEHALLTAALCRAAGIPSRVVVGVTYLNNFLGTMNCFGGHEWTEVFIGSEWIGLDAAFSEPGKRGFDAGHIALATGNGEPGDFFNLAVILGLFEIEEVKIIN